MEPSAPQPIRTTYSLPERPELRDRDQLLAMNEAMEAHWGRIYVQLFLKGIEPHWPKEVDRLGLVYRAEGWRGFAMGPPPSDGTQANTIGAIGMYENDDFIKQIKDLFPRFFEAINDQELIKRKGFGEAYKAMGCNNFSRSEIPALINRLVPPDIQAQERSQALEQHWGPSIETPSAPPKPRL